MSDDTAVPEEVTNEEIRDDELGAIFDKANAEESSEPTRDDKGRFATKDQASDAESVEGSEGAAEEIADTSAATEDEPVTVLDPPASWSATAKADWSGLTRELQDEVLRREGDWQKADGERATRLKGYEPVEAALAPVRQQLQLNGVNEGQYVSQLVAADQYLRTDPQAAIRWLSQQYGIDLSQIDAGLGEEIDPALAPFVDKMNALQNQVSSFVTTQQQQESSRVGAEIDAFAQGHSHFEEVRQQMGALIQAGAVADMDAAYDMAVWANPSTRIAMQAEQSVETEAKRKTEVEEKAAKARRVSQTNLSTQGTAGGATPPQYKSREDELSAIYDNVQGA